MKTTMEDVYYGSTKLEDALEYERVATLETHEANYSFDLVMVVRKDGELRWFQDSGCSCPLPFERVAWEDGSTDFDALWEYLEGLVGDPNPYWRSIVTSADIVDMKRKVYA